VGRDDAWWEMVDDRHDGARVAGMRKDYGREVLMRWMKRYYHTLAKNANPVQSLLLFLKSARETGHTRSFYHLNPLLPFFSRYAFHCIKADPR
jgi:hypothetical protein